MNHWKEVFIEQVYKINKIKNVKKIFISIIINNDNDLEYIKNNIIQDKYEIINISYNFTDYEFITLKFIQNLSQTEKFYCFYIHTKGVSINEKDERITSHYTLVSLLESINSWRRYMEYFLVNKADYIITQLNDYDAIGVSLRLDPEKHFSGNFWWSKSEYIKKLRKIEDVEYLKWRWNAEFWIGDKNMGNLLSLCDIHVGWGKIINTNEYMEIMGLQELYETENSLYPTDKGSDHSYLEIYTELFTPFKDRKINLIEIGFQYGGGLRLFEDWFTQANIIGYDIVDSNINTKYIIKRAKKIIKNCMEFTLEEFRDFPPHIIIDDASHILAEQIKMVEICYPQLQEGGLLIIEDIQDIVNSKSKFDALNIPYKLIDLRLNKQRYDDVLLVYKK